jgi:hypothetical protein
MVGVHGQDLRCSARGIYDRDGEIVQPDIFAERSYVPFAGRG